MVENIMKISVMQDNNSCQAMNAGMWMHGVAVIWTYNQAAPNPKSYLFLVSSCSSLCLIHWRQLLRREWRCSCSCDDRRCSNYIWVFNKFIAYEVAAHIRGLTVVIRRQWFPLSLTWISFNPSNHYKVLDEIIFRYKTSAMQPLKFVNG